MLGSCDLWRSFFPRAAALLSTEGDYEPRGTIEVVLDAGVNEMKEKRQAVTHPLAVGVSGVEIRPATPAINHTSTS